MKAYSTIISAVFVSACLILPADARNGRDWTPEHDGTRYGYSVRIGVGGYPLFDVGSFGLDGYAGFFGQYFDADPLFFEHTLRGIQSPDLGPGYETALFSAEIEMDIRRWFALSVGVGAAGVWQNALDVVTDGKIGTNRGVVLSLLPEARFYWLNKETVRMYSSAGIGVGLTAYKKVSYEDSHNSVYPLFQVAPVGITAGRRLYWFAECGIGMVYVGGKTGIGIRF